MPKTKKIGVVITAEARSGVAYIRIVDAISEYSMASSIEVRSQVDMFLSQGITTAEVYVNSRGGDCFEADEMCNELERFGVDNVSIIIGAVAASAATIFLAKFRSTAKPNSQIMIHRPRLGAYGDIQKIESDIVLLKNKTADYKTAYATKTGLSEDEIETLWAKGDVWLTAQEALAMKLIDAIEGTETIDVTAEDVSILEACGAPNIPQVTQQIIKEPVMEKKLLIAALGLSADATDEQIQKALEEAKSAKDTLDAQAESEETKKEKEAKKLVAKHLGRKVFKADMTAHYENWAKLDYEGCKVSLEAMTPLPQLSAMLDQVKDKLEARSEWTFEQWQEKDAAGLEALADTDPVAFDKLFKTQYK
jgi:ATP-dependent Clp protease protease subunit